MAVAWSKLGPGWSTSVAERVAEAGHGLIGGKVVRVMARFASGLAHLGQRAGD